MCGIVGTWLPDSYIFKDSSTLYKMVDTMQRALVHRGPDDEGVWCETNTALGLGHRRLSILDVSKAGHQPMESACGRYVIVFNGEIYNHKSIKKSLEDACGIIKWKGHSDTEMLLTAIATWGIESSLCQCVGMFSFALWDRKDHKLHLARDRMGEKPLYYGWQNGVLMFASELKALTHHPDWTGTIDKHALSLMLRYSYVPAPHSIYSGIQKLLPGTSVMFTAPNQQRIQPRAYWSVKQVAENGECNPFKGTDLEIRDELEKILRAAIRDQMISDVPLGAFLSGGIDSSLVVALMKEESTSPVRTFSIGFHESDYDEAVYAKQVARHIGTEHTELYVSPDQAMAVIPELPALYDEPFADSSQIPTYLLSQMVRQHVTVALSGDGGDELFGGYNRYFWTRSLWKKLGWLPLTVRKSAADIITSVSPASWDNLRQWITRLTSRGNYPQFGDKIYKVADLLSAENAEEIYWRLVSTWRDAKQPVAGLGQPELLLPEIRTSLMLRHLESRMMLFDQSSYLPDDILAKVDRAAMGVSLETRIPLLDHRVVEFAWRIPLSKKIRQGQGKWLLRQLLYKYVPQKMIDRPKQGFSIPLDSWLRGPLRDWAENLLDRNKLKHEGILDPQSIRQKWAEHLSGKRNWQYMLWNILMFQAWMETYNVHNTDPNF